MHRGVREEFGVDITNTEADQHLALFGNGFLAFTDELFSLSTSHLTVESCVLNIIRVATERLNITSHKRLAFAYGDFANTVEITNTRGVEVKEVSF
ncbi:hypothetical protein ALO48_200026 [Pseudomonas syringae pv. rhaphiolepidis]|nr:hypothetical protein ALO48_200026 [Pseudomonas syringae pv. rhaphiolepidis]